jgi:prolyl-tRNA synthetase
LIGVPYRVNVGKKAAERKVELVTRRTVSSEDVEIAQVAALLAEKAKRTYTGWTPPVTA